MLDPPVTPYSSREAIEAWIAELRAMLPQAPEAQAEIDRAQSWLDGMPE